ncbi:SUMF1/EgtB/PvdO family nonheme iron enzyme [Nodosilinea sp. P-1105]|uniref:SUMF1/EgtB/PvdO family nonheme iron enzyme n=1 Tax=Nodosilinea sp. P-1105 TaxID=2546229 RepID=UPI001F0D6FE0|nr:SUMF1/EgtB/PvdO family nonheme iron enzyme [Nodosilinea sp. P-1105]
MGAVLWLAAQASVLARPPAPIIPSPSPGTSVTLSQNQGQASPAPGASPLQTWPQQHSAFVNGALTVVILVLAYGGVLLVKPRWLLWLPGKLKIPNTPIDLPIGLLLWLKYQPRVLDAWVADHLLAVRKDFCKKGTVKDRSIHIPIQIQLDGQLVDELTPALLRPGFSRSPATLLLVGEGGVGKTSFACQIARWGLGLVDTNDPSPQALCKQAMLPVLIEQELDNTPLRIAIRDQLPRNPDGTFIADDLLDALLRQRRVLVILDHVSEMSDGTYNQMKQALEATPINALIITSRLKEKNLGRPSYDLLQPQKIEGGKLSRFIEPYLEAQGQKDLFEDDTEFYRTCTRLSSMMAATLQSATALLVRMYVDQVIEAGGLKTAQLPDNIPALMLSYLRWLNRPEQVDASQRHDNDQVQQDAKRVAWECLKHTYRPTDAKRPDVLAALGATEPGSATEAAKARLTYLEKPLGLVQQEPAVKIVLDPVAEYLAALHVTEFCQQAEPTERWQQFFETLTADDETLAAMRGFLLAVRNCAEAERPLPEPVLPCLNEVAALDSDALEQARRRQRVNKLIDELYDSEDKYLEQAIHNLRDEGHYAQRAIPDLLKLLSSPQREPTLRTEALTALMQIQPDQTALGQLLQDLLANRGDASEVRVAAIKGLLQIGDRVDGLVPLLQGYFDDTSDVGTVRVQAGEGLRKLGVLQQLLVVQVFDLYTHQIQLVEPPKTHILKLSEDVELTLVYIPGGQFLMGSPEGEGYSDEYPQHEVTIEEFWLGQCPVTQSQYEAVVGSNPATFRLGGNHPVETVNWHAAVAFCQRLSELTELEFRLPSEAEWEYACRAGTTTPFHFGPTITTDLANYRGTDWDYGGQILSGSYGPGPKGIFREQTTPVGQFPPNAFGLYDMHGNVWEWCADHYHDNYEGAPNNNAPWLSSDKRNDRLLRGGSWSNPPQNCRSFVRNYDSPDYRNNYFGFRVVGSAARALL